MNMDLDELQIYQSRNDPAVIAILEASGDYKTQFDGDGAVGGLKNKTPMEIAMDFKRILTFFESTNSPAPYLLWLTGKQIATLDNFVTLRGTPKLFHWMQNTWPELTRIEIRDISRINERENG